MDPKTMLITKQLPKGRYPVAEYFEDLEWRAREAVANTVCRYEAAGRARACNWEAIQTALEIEFGAAFPGDLPSGVRKLALEAFLDIHWHRQ